MWCLKRKEGVKVRLAALFLMLLPAFAAPAELSAAVNLTPTVEAAFGGLASEADPAMRAAMGKLMSDLTVLDAQDLQWEEKVKNLQFRNEETLGILYKQINRIGADNVQKLEAEVKQAKARYRPLFDYYASLNRQITAARRIGSKQAVSLLRAQADGVRISTQLARLDIRNKEDRLRAAKDAAAKAKARIRGTLAAADPLKVRLKADRSAIARHKRSLSDPLDSFKRAVKKKDAAGATAALSELVTLSRQIVERKQASYDLESRISTVIQQAKGQLP